MTPFSSGAMSSQYASQRNANVARSAPADGSITCGTIPFLRLLVEVAQVFAAAAMLGLAVFAHLDDQLVALPHQLPSMWLRRS